MRLIDADALIEKLRQSPYSAEGPFGKGYSEGSIVRMIERVPTITPERIDEIEYDAQVAEMAGIAETVEMEGCNEGN